MLLAPSPTLPKPSPSVAKKLIWGTGTRFHHFQTRSTWNHFRSRWIKMVLGESHITEPRYCRKSLTLSSAESREHVFAIFKPEEVEITSGRVEAEISRYCYMCFTEHHLNSTRLEVISTTSGLKMAFIRNTATITTNDFYPRPIFWARRLIGTQLLIEVLQYINQPEYFQFGRNFLAYVASMYGISLI